MSEPAHRGTRGVLDTSDASEETSTWDSSAAQPDNWEQTRQDQASEEPDAGTTREMPAKPLEEDTPEESRNESTTRIDPVREREPLSSRNRGLTESQRARVATWLNPTTGVWLGLALVAAGFVSIFYSWGKVAGVLNVAQQMPYLVSGGITGLALVIVGVTAVDVAVRRQDSHERKQQNAQIMRTLDELLDVLESEADIENEREG